MSYIRLNSTAHGFQELKLNSILEAFNIYQNFHVTFRIFKKVLTLSEQITLISIYHAIE